MNRRGELDAIVVGGGPVGAALALALARDGFDIALIETYLPKPWQREDEVDLRVVALAPDAVILLDNLGVWNTIAATRVNPYRHMDIWDALAPGSLHFNAAERGESALGFIVENRLIQHTLWHAIGAHGGIRILCPATVADVENSTDAAIVTLTDGTRLRSRLLIAADGAESLLRNKLGIDYSGHNYDLRAVVAHVTPERPHENTAWQRFLPAGPLALLPLADGRCSIVWSLPDAEATRILALDDEIFCAQLGCAFDFRLGVITATTPRAAFPLRLRLAKRYMSGRCVLAGDAAHVVHPLAGQGMNLGLRDVRCLRAVLTQARAHQADIGAAHVLRRYERERISENTLAAGSFDVIHQSFSSGALPLVTLRGLALTAVNRLPPLKHFFADAAAGRL